MSLTARHERELEHHEQLYAGEAQALFARPAVRAFRGHLVERLTRRLRLGPESRVLSLGCGIGDTELLLAPRVGCVTGLDLSPRAIAQARADAEQRGVRNARFESGDYAALGEERFDAVMAVFFLHHLGQEELAAFPRWLSGRLQAGGRFYALDPSRWRLSGAVGRLLVPRLMKHYQSDDEHPVHPRRLPGLFRQAGFAVEAGFYDFVSTPLAGLFPGWAAGYRAARVLDEALVRAPGLRWVASNFELLARL
jgi:cyclopropane fatty-acyl-phospholipid synthase-like methyltransferase